MEIHVHYFIELGCSPITEQYLWLFFHLRHKMLTVVFRRRLYSAAELTSSINSLLFFINNVFFLVILISNVNKGCGYYKMLKVLVYWVKKQNCTIIVWWNLTWTKCDFSSQFKCIGGHFFSWCHPYIESTTVLWYNKHYTHGESMYM